MESTTEIVLESEDELTLEVEVEPEPELLTRVLPFSFAKRHGVLIREISDGMADAVYRAGASPISLA